MPTHQSALLYLFALGITWALSLCCDPIAGRWNMVALGNTHVGACVEHVDFMLFVSSLLANADTDSGGICV